MAIETIPLQLNLQHKRQVEAQSWRQSLTSRGVLCLNLISSPGAGKTSLLQAMARHWGGSLETQDLEILVIENVGNLVCPASHDLGEHLRVVVLSVTEGDDKPGKYPKAFRTSQVCVINKVDLLPYVPFSLAAVTADAHAVHGDLPLFATSATTGEGIALFCDFLVTQRRNLLHRDANVL